MLRFQTNPTRLLDVMWSTIDGLVDRSLEAGNTPTEIAEEFVDLIERLDRFMRDNADPVDREKFQKEIRERFDRALGWKGLPNIELRGQMTIRPKYPHELDEYEE